MIAFESAVDPQNTAVKATMPVSVVELGELCVVAQPGDRISPRQKIIALESPLNGSPKMTPLVIYFRASARVACSPLSRLFFSIVFQILSC